MNLESRWTKQNYDYLETILRKYETLLRNYEKLGKLKLSQVQLQKIMRDYAKKPRKITNISQK